MLKLNFQKIGIALLYMFTICIYCFDGDPQLNKIMYAVGVLFLIAAIMSVGGLKKVPASFIIDLLPFVIFCFMSCAWSVNPDVSLRRSITLLENFVVFWVMWLFIARNKLQQHVIRAISLAGSIFAIYIVAYYGGLRAFIRLMEMANMRTRIGGEVAHLSQIGQSLSISSVFMFSLALKEIGWKRIIRYGLVIIQVIVILASQSRTGLLIFLLGSGFTLFEYMKKRGSNGGVVTVVLIILVCIVLTRMIDLASVLERWEGVFSTGGKDSSSVTRIAMINEGISFFFYRPLLGYGVGTSGSISVYETYFHNNYVELLATTGILGFILHYRMFIKTLCCLLRISKNKGEDSFLIQTTTISVVLLLVLMFFTVTYYVKYIYLIIVLMLSVVYIQPGSSETIQNKGE